MTFQLPEPGTLYYRHGEELKYYTEAQIKQALRDALEQAAQECVAQESYGPRHQSIYDCAEAIRKMIGEI